MKRLFFLLYMLSFNAVYGQNSLIPFIQNGKWGYCDKNLKIVIPCKYDQAYPFFEERALVQFYDTIEPYAKSFFIDPKGDVIIRLNSSAPGCPASRFHKGVALVENYNIPNYGENTNITVIDRDGNILHLVDGASMDADLSMLKEYGNGFNSEGIYCTQLYVDDQTKSVLIYNDNRKPVILNYQYISPFNGGYAVAQEQYLEGVVEPNLALINTKGEVVIPAGKHKLVMDYYNTAQKPELLFPFDLNGKQGYVNINGEIIIEPKFDLAFSFNEGRAVVAKLIGYDEYEMPIYKFGYIDTKGNLVIPFLYDQAFAFSEDLAEVVNKDSIMFIDYNGKTVLSYNSSTPKDMYGVPGQYGAYYYEHGFKNGSAVLFIDNQVGFINKKGDFIIEPMYNGLGRIGPSMVINSFENGILRINPNTSLGYYEYYIDESGKPYFEPQKMLLQAKKGIIKSFSNPSKNSPADTLQSYECPVIVKYTGKKDKIDGKKGEWIEIEDWEKKSYVFSADFHTTSVLTTNLKGNELYESKDSKDPFVKIPSGSILFLAPKEKITKIGSTKMVNVLFFTTDIESESGFVTKSLWIQGDQIKLFNK
jgi:hypothetical protein